MLRLATMQDLTRIMAIVQATVMEMHAYGNYQWDEVYPTEQDFAADITQGDLFVSEAERQICGLGLRYLKTDTYALNEKAQQLFLKHGYHFCGEIQFRKMEHQFYCYEKVL